MQTLKRLVRALTLNQTASLARSWSRVVLIFEIHYPSLEALHLVCQPPPPRATCCGCALSPHLHANSTLPHEKGIIGFPVCITQQEQLQRSKDQQHTAQQAREDLHRALQRVHDLESKLSVAAADVARARAERDFLQQTDRAEENNARTLEVRCQAYSGKTMRGCMSQRASLE